MTPKRRARPVPAPGTLGRRIHDQRHHICLTQVDLAEACGVSQSAVAQWERNVTVPSLRMRPILATALRISRRRLFDVDADEAESA